MLGMVVPLLWRGSGLGVEGASVTVAVGGQLWAEPGWLTPRACRSCAFCRVCKQLAAIVRQRGGEVWE